MACDMTATAARARLPYYGWVITGTLAVTETVSWGVLYYAFSVFLVPMQEDLGWSPAALTGAYSLALLVSGLSAPVAGRWIDRHGPRALMTTGSLLGVLLVVAWAGVDGLAGYYLLWAGMGLAMAATLYEPAFATLARWFVRDYRRAILVVTVAAGFASTIFLPLSAWLVERAGWRSALLILAGILAATTIPLHALVLRRRPEDLGLHPDGDPPDVAITEMAARAAAGGATLHQALRDGAFWWLTAAFFLDAVSTGAVRVSLIPYLTERGDGAAFAAVSAGLIGAAQVGARILATVFGSRLSPVALTALVFGMQAAAVAMLAGWQARSGVLAAVLVMGAANGVVTLMRAGLVAEFWGRAHFGAISGMLALFLTGARALAPIGAGATSTLAGGYQPVLLTMVLVSTLAAIAMMNTRRKRQARS
jgi:MFS family permease